MLIEQLLAIAQKGSEKPLVLWLDEFWVLADNLLPNLEVLANEIDQETDVVANLQKLIAVLKEDSPKEIELSRCLSHIADVLDKKAGGRSNETVSNYLRSVMQFTNLAQMGEFAGQTRNNLKNKLSIQDQKDYDLKLFKHEGMLYCLEYYLALYKAIVDTPDEKNKRKYIENIEINLGFGKVPGLWIDFSRNEVLNKFIYLVLEDELRLQLLRIYFDLKLKLMKIEMHCDKQMVCQVKYNSITIEEVVGAYKHFLAELLTVFHNVGVENLTSLFFKPYGDKPAVNEVIKML